MKDAYYFSHDSNAKDDPKCVLLIEQLGLEGYGIFWVLIETLRDQPEYKYPLILIPALARRYNTTAEKIKTVVMSYGLFQVYNDEFFYSESLLERMQVLENKRLKASEAGKISAKKRQQMLNGRSTDVQQPFNECSTTVQPVKESIENEIKEDQNIYVGDPKIEIKTDNDTKTFIDKVLKRYGILEGNNQRAYMDNYSMVARYMAGDLKTDDDILYFRKQISFYFNYKDKSGEKLHSLPKLITEAWKQCNWAEKIKEVISTPQNGKSNGQNTKMPIGHIYTDSNYVPAVTWGLGENKI